jgi:hypothetical protein
LTDTADNDPGSSMSVARPRHETLGFPAIPPYHWRINLHSTISLAYKLFKSSQERLSITPPNHCYHPFLFTPLLRAKQAIAVRECVNSERQQQCRHPNGNTPAGELTARRLLGRLLRRCHYDGPTAAGQPRITAVFVPLDPDVLAVADADAKAAGLSRSEMVELVGEVCRGAKVRCVTNVVRHPCFPSSSARQHNPRMPTRPPHHRPPASTLPSHPRTTHLFLEGEAEEPARRFWLGVVT